MKEHKATFDFLLNTVPNPHDANPYLELLKLDGTMVWSAASTRWNPASSAAS